MQNQDTEQSPEARRPGEPSLCFLRFKYFLRMGSGRSLLGVFHLVQDKKGRKKDKQYTNFLEKRVQEMEMANARRGMGR